MFEVGLEFLKRVCNIEMYGDGSSYKIQKLFVNHIPKLSTLFDLILTRISYFMDGYLLDGSFDDDSLFDELTTCFMIVF